MSKKKETSFPSDSEFRARMESEERLKLAVEGTGVGLWDWQVQTGACVYNDQWARIVGYTLDELAPLSFQTWIDLCHPEDLAESQRLLEAHFAGKTERYRCIARMRHKEGRAPWRSSGSGCWIKARWSSGMTRAAPCA